MEWKNYWSRLLQLEMMNCRSVVTESSFYMDISILEGQSRQIFDREVSYEQFSPTVWLTVE